MNFRKLAKVPQHKRFDFTPRYYDEDKEKFEQRKRWIQAEVRLQKHEKESQQEELKVSEGSEEYEGAASFTGIRGSFGRVKDKRKTLFGNLSIAVLFVILIGTLYVFKNLGTGGIDFNWKVYAIIFAIAIYVLLRIKANSKVRG